MDYTVHWNSPGQNIGVGSLSLLQVIFPTQESNPGLLHCRQILLTTGPQRDSSPTSKLLAVLLAQSCPTLCDPIDWTLREGNGNPLQCSCLENPRDEGAAVYGIAQQQQWQTGSCQASLSLGFSRQEYRNGLPFPSPGIYPTQGIEPGSSALQIDSLLFEPPGKSWSLMDSSYRGV